MNAPEAQDQIVSGIFSLEGKIRWTSRTATVVLKSPAAPTPLRAEFTIHPSPAPARSACCSTAAKSPRRRTPDRGLTRSRPRR